MSREENLGMIDRSARTRRDFSGARWLLPAGWVLAAVGFLGPWIAHGTSALTLSGVDMGEFVKFLPGVQDGSLPVVRQLFYLPPLAVVATVALLIGSRRLHYAWPLRVLMLILALILSLQLLPPAWSPASLMTSEFRLQAIALGLLWLLLAGLWLWGHLPGWLTGSLSAVLSLLAMGLSVWQFVVVKPAIDEVYRTPPSTGWGFLICMAGLLIITAGSIILALRSRVKGWSGEVWSSE